MGAVTILGGLAMTVFNKQVGALVLAMRGKLAIWDAVLDMKIYQPTGSGRVPILMFIGIGWLIMGVFFIVLALTDV